MGRAKSADPRPLSSFQLLHVEKKISKHKKYFHISIIKSVKHSNICQSWSIYLKLHCLGKNPLCGSPPSQFQLQPPLSLSSSSLPYLSILVVLLLLQTVCIV